MKTSNLIQGEKSLSKDFGDFVFCIEKGYNWGFSYLGDSFIKTAQLEESEMEFFAFFLYKHMDLSFIPDFKRLKEFEKKEKELVRMNDVCEDLVNRNNELVELLKKMVNTFDSIGKLKSKSTKLLIDRAKKELE